MLVILHVPAQTRSVCSETRSVALLFPTVPGLCSWPPAREEHWEMQARDGRWNKADVRVFLSCSLHAAVSKSLVLDNSAYGVIFLNLDHSPLVIP